MLIPRIVRRSIRVAFRHVSLTVLSRRAIGGEKTLETIEALYRRRQTADGDDRPPPIRVALCEVLPRPNPAAAATTDPEARAAFLRAVVRHRVLDAVYNAHVSEQPHAATADGTVRQTEPPGPLDSDASDVRRPGYRIAIARSVARQSTRCGECFLGFFFPVFVWFIYPLTLSQRLRTGPRHDGQVFSGSDGRNGTRAQRFSREFSIDSGFNKRKNIFN